jgi:hypothetical protein
VIALFARDPFAGAPPRMVRAVVWQYWFTDPETKRRTGAWWRREPIGMYGPALERDDDGTIAIAPPDRQPTFGPTAPRADQPNLGP